MGRTKQWGTETLEICGRDRDGTGNMGNRRWTLQGLSGRKENLTEVGLGWINGGRKDRGFGWGMIRGGGEQLFLRPGGKNGNE